MKVHFIAIGGTIMHSLAIELKKNGYIVTGSDDVIYEPSRSNLKKNNLLPNDDGWSIKNIVLDLDMVILGMHAKPNNPEIIEAQKHNIPIVSFPEFIANYALNKKRVVIAGSHGKTTITAMILHVLSLNNVNVDYLLGAKINLLDQQVQLNNNDVMIIEGDEYYSSILDKQPKFMHYNPDILVVSGVQWDHINVFPSFHEYKEAFITFFNAVIKNNSKIYYCNNDNFLIDFFSQKNTYSQSYNLPSYYIKNNSVILRYNNQEFPLNIFGQHNLYNLEAAKYVCRELGVDEENFYSSIQSFKGAARRLSILKKYEDHSIVYYDFAHSPSKVYATINALHELYPKRYLIACLELHTFSSLDKDFIPNYFNMVNQCDEFWLFVDEETLIRKKMDKLDDVFLIKSFNHMNMIVIKDRIKLKNQIERLQILEINLLFMSSGNFAGLDLKNIFN